MPLINTQTLRWECDGCMASHGVKDSPIAVSALARVPFLPDGWTQIRNLVFCPEHNISVCVDFKIVLEIKR